MGPRGLSQSLDPHCGRELLLGRGWGSFEGLEAGVPSEPRTPQGQGSWLHNCSLCVVCLCPCGLWAGPPAPVLSIHKLPASGATDISFPMKGWRATGDWAKVPEDRVTVSKSVFSTGLAGEGPQAAGGALSGDSGPGVRGPTPQGASFWDLACCFKGQDSLHFFSVFLRSPPPPGSPPCPPAFGGS